MDLDDFLGAVEIAHGTLDLNHASVYVEVNGTKRKITALESDDDGDLILYI